MITNRISGKTHTSLTIKYSNRCYIFDDGVWWISGRRLYIDTTTLKLDVYTSSTRIRFNDTPPLLYFGQGI